MKKESPVAPQQNYFHGTGRRKTSISTVRLHAGSGRIWVNGRKMDEYFSNRPRLIRKVWEPLVVTGVKARYDIVANAIGGGVSGQADALSLGIARALMNMNTELRPVLRKAGLVTRDPRAKERKKYGQKRARKRFQYTKR